MMNQDNATVGVVEVLKKVSTCMFCYAAVVDHNVP